MRSAKVKGVFISGKFSAEATARSLWNALMKAKDDGQEAEQIAEHQLITEFREFTMLKKRYSKPIKTGKSY